MEKQIKWPWEKVYIINLDTMKHRYKKLVKSLKKNNISKNIKRISGVYGIKELPYGKDIESSDNKNLKWTYIEKMNENLKKKGLMHYKIGIKYPYLKPGQIGHLLSFIKTLKHAQKYNYKSILILEDDAVIMDNFVNNFKTAYKYVPDNWDLIYVGLPDIHLRIDKPVKINKYVCKLNGIKLYNKSTKYKRMKYNTYQNAIWGTHAIIMNRKCIDIFLDKVLPLKIPSDVLLGRLSTTHKLINSYYLCNNLIKESSTTFQYSTTSDI